MTNHSPISPDLLNDLRALIGQSRQKVALVINAEITRLYWAIGKRINIEVLGQGRAEYGKQTIRQLSDRLTAEYGKGFSPANLTNAIELARLYPDVSIIQTLSEQFTWSHLVTLLYVKDDLKREFYTQMARLERWSVRMLRQKIDGMLYERTAISQQPDETIRRELAELHETDRLTPDMVFRDPYVLDFLGLEKTYSEEELEDAIVSELQKFIIELGSDFAFMARQKRIVIDGDDHRIDLLFYHRRLRRLVAIDLKLGRFKAAYKGQMELYLGWLRKHEMLEGENNPIGLILCAEKSHEHIELLELDKGDIRVAEYLTHQLPRTLLEQKLHTAIEQARKRLEKAKEDQ
ncbi:PDDEXK nuclease domain-containing protein [Rudanella lutea]|uniref:PDDEXK nuclease domain-containing protein n=1 Tax=Rudanella lutea TaxID=451374 RepID=UPI00037C19AB|nr:PDDEXK nuclease domain-containing protein [Rudanella lutea]